MSDFSYLLIGGDKRQEHLYNLLSYKNKKVDTIFTNNKFDTLESLNKINNFLRNEINISVILLLIQFIKWRD